MKPLDSCGNRVPAVIPAHLTAPSCQYCPCRLGEDDPRPFPRSIKPGSHSNHPRFARPQASAALHQRRRNSEPLDALQDRGEQLARHRQFGHLERHVLRMPNHFGPTRFTNVSLGHERQPRRSNGGGTPNRWMRSRIVANNSRGTATSAIWKITYPECLTTLAPILISFSRSVVNDQY